MPLGIQIDKQYRRPSAASSAARLTDTVVLPVPPLRLEMAMIWGSVDMADQFLAMESRQRAFDGLTQFSSDERFRQCGLDAYQRGRLEIELRADDAASAGNGNDRNLVPGPSQRLEVSMPSMFGISMSVMIRSGLTSAACRSPSAPSPASLT